MIQKSKLNKGQQAKPLFFAVFLDTQGFGVKVSSITVGNKKLPSGFLCQQASIILLQLVEA